MLRVMLPALGDTAVEATSHTCGEALVQVLRRVRGSRPLVVILEDLHWAEAERCETRVVLAAIGKLVPPPPPGAGGPFALSTPGKLEELAEAAGLTPQRADEVPTPYVYPDLDTAVRAQLAAGPSRKAIEHAGLLATVEAIRDAFLRQPAAGRQLPPGQRVPLSGRHGVTVAVHDPRQRGLCLSTSRRRPGYPHTGADHEPSVQ